jgi:hypothetical protein
MRGIIPWRQKASSPCCYMGPIHALFFCIFRFMSKLPVLWYLLLIYHAGVSYLCVPQPQQPHLERVHTFCLKYVLVLFASCMCQIQLLPNVCTCMYSVHTYGQVTDKSTYLRLNSTFLVIYQSVPSTEYIQSTYFYALSCTFSLVLKGRSVYKLTP